MDDQEFALKIREETGCGPECEIAAWYDLDALCHVAAHWFPVIEGQKRNYCAFGQVGAFKPDQVRMFAGAIAKGHAEGK